MHGVVDSHAVESKEHVVKQLKMMESVNCVISMQRLDIKMNTNLIPSKQLATINDEWKTF